VLGHESAGVVEAVGSSVSTVGVGDAVMIYPPFSCGLSLACRRGLDMHCERHGFYGLTLDGGFAERMVVAERSLARLPSGVDPVAVAPHADVDADRRPRAAELGFDRVLDGAGAVAAVRDLTDGRGADVVLDAVGTDATHADALAMLARRETYSLVGYGGTLSVASLDMVENERTAIGNLVGSWPDLWEVLQLHAAGRIRLRTETHPLEAVNDVLDRLRAGDVTARAVIVPG
jgi:NAD+-dependent secondary alcohol dehydrogenase Adh1